MRSKKSKRNFDKQQSKMLRVILTATNFRSPLLRTVVPTVAAALALQGAVAIPSIIAQTERFYDLSGSLTYISCTALSLYLPILRARVLTGGATASSIVGWPSLWKSALGRSAAEGGFWDWRQIALSAAVFIWASRCVSSAPILSGLSLTAAQWEAISFLA